MWKRKTLFVASARQIHYFMENILGAEFCFRINIQKSKNEIFYTFCPYNI